MKDGDSKSQSSKGYRLHLFCTPKSKYRKGIEKKYDRVASEIGRQTFTDKDAIDGFVVVLEKIICGSRMLKTPSTKLKPGTAYIQDSVFGQLSNLYTLDLSTGKATLVGAITSEVADIAFVRSHLYGLDLKDGGQTMQLIDIDPVTGITTVVGDIGAYAVGLAYNNQSNVLYATTAKQLVAINLETGASKPIATVANQDYNCGEVAFDRHGKAYITLIGYERRKLLATCDLDTGKVTTIGDIGFPNLASMEFYDDVLYGVTGSFFGLGDDGQLLRIDTTTGAGTLVTMTNPIGRWAGISIYEPIPKATSRITLEANPRATESVTTGRTTSSTPEVKELGMNILTIDPKENCYVINESWIKDLQEKRANLLTLERGTYDIQIQSDQYSYSKTKTEREPLVLLWIYGSNGKTFVNKNTGFEIRTTWRTLNGKKNDLTLEIKEKVNLCVLFFGVDIANSSEAIILSVTSNKPYFNPLSLTANSEENCYVLDEKYLLSLKHRGSNFIDLNPGKYEIKIRPDSQISYWLENKKIESEPQALIWIKGGKFITKQTRIEVTESWESLNGYEDRVFLEVKDKTTLSGLFFDTHNEDNGGKIILSVEKSASPLIPSRITSPAYSSVTSPKLSQLPSLPNLSKIWDIRNPQTDIICVSPIRTVIRREEEIVLIRKVHKVEEIDANPTCPVNSIQVQPESDVL